MAKEKVQNSNENAPKIKKEEIVEISIDSLENFKNHPFKIIDGSLEELKESIIESGITTPLIVREKEKGKFEIVSGHRRKRACEILGISKVPCIVRKINDVEAIVQMVDSNIQRDEVLFSEKAFAYKMKYEALKHQGKRNDLTSTPLEEKLNSNEKLASEVNESREQIRRYIRLTELIPELLQMVDDKKIAFRTAVELSYLTKKEQLFLLDSINSLEATPSLAQAIEMKRLSKSGALTDEKIDDILGIEKPNQIPKYQISYEKFTKYIPRNIVTPKELEDYLLKCSIYCKEHKIEIEKMKIIPQSNKPKNKDRER